MFPLWTLLAYMARRSIIISGSYAFNNPSFDDSDFISRLPDKYIIDLRMHVLSTIGGNALENKLPPAKITKLVQDNGSFCR